MRGLLIVGVLGAAAVAFAAPVVPHPERMERIAIPGGEPGVGYDDLQYGAGLRLILVPAGRTGRLALIDPATRKVTSVEGFSAASAYPGGHGQGTTSAAELDGARGLVVATDRGSRTLKVVDVRAGRIVASVGLAGAPDYVRVVGPAREVWVTEPAAKQVEVLKVDHAWSLSRVAIVPVPDGPESLVVDGARGRAYMHGWTTDSYAVDLGARKVVGTWKNGCRASRGIALDDRRGLLFSGCAEGRATVVDLATHRILATAPTGREVDSIGYAASLGHLFVPAAADGTLAIFGVSAEGGLARLGQFATAEDAHTVAFDPVSGAIFVGTPERGAVLVARDVFPSSLGRSP